VRKKRIVTFAGLFLTLAAGATAAAAQEATGRLAGSVLLAADESPLEDVRVMVRGTGRAAVTDSMGGFRIDSVPAGDHVLAVRYLDMLSDVAGSVSVSVAENETVVLSILLEIHAMPVPELVVEIERVDNAGKMTGFEQRRASAFGSFLTREDIERAQPDRLSQLFYAVPGVRVVRPPGGDIFGTRLISARGGIECTMLLYLDGIRTSQDAFNIDLLRPGDIEGVEVYNGASRTPAIFSYRGARCGAVAIWTRDPTRQDREE
jgi:hypothetical protein